MGVTWGCVKRGWTGRGASGGGGRVCAGEQRAADLGVSTVWVDALNPRPRVWPAVARLLRQRFPELRERYQRILFDGQSRAEYLDQLRSRVATAAKRLSQTGRVSVCF